MENFSLHNRRWGLLADFVTLLLSFSLTYSLLTLLSSHVPFPFDGAIYYRTYAILLLAGVVALFVFAEYPTRRMTTSWYEMKLALRINLILVVTFAVFSFLVKLESFSRLFIGTYFFVNMLLAVGSRLFIRLVLGIRRKAGWDVKTRLIVGCGEAAINYSTRVEQQPHVGIRILGYVADRRETICMPYLGEVEDLRAVLGRNQVDGVVIALPMTDSRIEVVLDECDLHGTPVELMLDNLSTKLVHSRIVSGMGLPRITLSRASHSPEALVLKRLTDVILSGTALFLLSPLFLILSLGIKLDDGGPVMFSQTRVGQFGKPFQIHKFRSMRVDAERIREQLLHLNEMSGPVFKISDDPRVTRIGRWLRKLSLDELPQLYDVFVGNMSLVGPRPPLPTEVEQYDVQHRRRLSVKPGMTCLWQISGRNEIDFQHWMELDLAYIDNWSLGEDLRILMRTIPAVLKGRGAS